jgi:hypothetical protein
MPFVLRIRQIGFLAGLVSLALAVEAGVLGPTEGSASDAARTSQDVLKTSKTASETQASRTVDLLIELQDKRPGVDFSQRAGATSAGGSSTANATRVETQVTRAAEAEAAREKPRLGLFGTQATPPVVREPAANTNRVEAAAGGDEVGTSKRAAARSMEQAPWWMHPAGWLRELRDNREWLIGAALLALVIWGATRWAARHAH